MDITASTAPKSDQQNYDDYATTSRTVTITEVKAGSAEQPVEVHLAEFPGRPYKPSKSMRRVMVAAWGPEASNYTGRRLTLYGDPTVKFGGIALGGIKISHLSDIDKTLNLSLTASKGHRAPHTVEPLTEAAPPAEPSPEDRASKAVAWFSAKGVERQHLEAHVGLPIAEWTAEHIDELTESRESIVSESTGDQT